MAINLSDNLKINTSKPVDTRLIMNSRADLSDASKWPNGGLELFAGLVSYTKLEKSLYVLTDADFTDPDNWVEVGSGGGGANWKYVDLTSQIDGVTNSFTLPVDYKVDTPVIAFLNKGIKPDYDYTIAGNILTFNTIVPEVGDEFWVYYSLAGSPVISKNYYLGLFYTADKTLENLDMGNTDGQKAFVFQDSQSPGVGVANSIYIWDETALEWVFNKTIVPFNDLKFLTEHKPTLFIYDGITNFDWFSGSGYDPDEISIDLNPSNELEVKDYGVVPKKLSHGTAGQFLRTNSTGDEAIWADYESSGLTLSTWGRRIGNALYSVVTVPNPINIKNNLPIDTFYTTGDAMGVFCPPGYSISPEGDFNFNIMEFPWINNIVLDSNDYLIGFDIDWGGQSVNTWNQTDFGLILMGYHTKTVKEITVGENLKSSSIHFMNYDPTHWTSGKKSIGDENGDNYILISNDGSIDFYYNNEVFNLILANGSRNEFGNGIIDFHYGELTFLQDCVVVDNDIVSGDEIADYDVIINKFDYYDLQITNLIWEPFNSDTLYDIENAYVNQLALAKFCADEQYNNQPYESFPSAIFQANPNSNWGEPNYISTENFVKPTDNFLNFNVLVSSITPTPVESNLGYGDVFEGANGYRAIYYNWYNDGSNDYVVLAPVYEFNWEIIALLPNKTLIDQKADKFLRPAAVQPGSYLNGLTFTKNWDTSFAVPFTAIISKDMWGIQHGTIVSDGSNIVYTDTNNTVHNIFTNGVRTDEFTGDVFYGNFIQSVTGIFPKNLLVRHMNLSDFDNIYSEKYDVNILDISVGASFSGVHLNLPLFKNATADGYDVTKTVSCEGKSDDLDDPLLYPYNIHFEGNDTGDADSLNIWIEDYRYGDHISPGIEYAIQNGNIGIFNYYDTSCNDNILYLPDVIVTDVSNDSFVNNAYVVSYGAKQLFDDINGGVVNRNFWWDDKIAVNEGIADSITNQLDFLYDNAGHKINRFPLYADGVYDVDDKFRVTISGTDGNLVNEFLHIEQLGGYNYRIWSDYLKITASTGTAHVKLEVLNDEVFEDALAQKTNYEG